VTPYDAKGMMNAASPARPGVFFESQKIYDYGERFEEAGVPEGYYEIELGEPSIKRQGKDLTIITLGRRFTRGNRSGPPASGIWISAELVDLRAANPLNYDALVESVRKTGKSCWPATRWSAAALCKRWRRL